MPLQMPYSKTLVGSAVGATLGVAVLVGLVVRGRTDTNAASTGGGTPQSPERPSEPVAEAAFRDAIRYARGDGVPKDETAARERYANAADRGHLGSKNNLAVMLAEGLGGRVDEKAALKLLTEASGKGHPAATCNLGVMYFWGRGVATDEMAAYALYVNAAQAGYVPAMRNLGQLVEDRESGRAREGLEWVQKAADRGDAASIYMLGMYYDRMWTYGFPDKSVEKARDLYVRAADLGQPNATYALAIHYLEGLGRFPTDYAEGLRWSLKGAEQNSRSAMFNVGYIYREGLGVPPDPEKAERWFARLRGAGEPEKVPFKHVLMAVD